MERRLVWRTRLIIFCWCWIAGFWVVPMKPHEYTSALQIFGAIGGRVILAAVVYGAVGWLLAWIIVNFMTGWIAQTEAPRPPPEINIVYTPIDELTRRASHSEAFKQKTQTPSPPPPMSEAMRPQRRVPCNACGGFGTVGEDMCAECKGSGVVVREQRF